MPANQSDSSFGSQKTTAQAQRRKVLDTRAKLNDWVPMAFRGCRHSSLTAFCYNQDTMRLLKRKTYTEETYSSVYLKSAHWKRYRAEKYKKYPLCWLSWLPRSSHMQIGTLM